MEAKAGCWIEILYVKSACSDIKGPLVSALKNLHQSNPGASKKTHISSKLLYTGTHFHPASIQPCNFMDLLLSINCRDGL